MSRSLFALLLGLSTAPLLGCGGSGPIDVEPDFSSGELAAFRDEFVAVVTEMKTVVESDGVNALLKESSALQQRMYDKYPKDAGAQENIISDLTGQLDEIIDEANESSAETVASNLDGLAQQLKSL